MRTITITADRAGSREPADINIEHIVIYGTVRLKGIARTRIDFVEGHVYVFETPEEVRKRIKAACSTMNTF